MAHDFGDVARGDVLLGNRTCQLADDLLVGFLEQVDGY